MGNRERAVTEQQVREVVAAIKAGKGTIMGEARRIGCYHASLRKHIRRVIGEQAYNKLPLLGGGGEKRKRVELTEPLVRAAIDRLRSGTCSFQTECARLFCTAVALRKAIAALDAEFGESILAKPATSPAVPPGCGHRFNAGTDGDGHALVWCVDCGHEEAVVPRRLAPPGGEDTPEDDG